jgi:hypothetical protein
MKCNEMKEGGERRCWRREKTSSFRKSGIKIKFPLNLHDFKSTALCSGVLGREVHAEMFMESSDLRRLLAKQRARWEDNINVDLKETGRQVANWIILAHVGTCRCGNGYSDFTNF